ncbi:MAG: YicC/YloC family endoribonuclease [Bdellovibrionales bacterium]
MKSMTGYGSAQSKTDQVEITVNVRAVNGRFLETRFHIPKEYMPYESRLKKELAKCFTRGTVDIYVTRRAVSGINFRVHKTTAKKWLSAQKELARELSIPLNEDYLVDRISNLPQVLEVIESHGVSESEKKFLNRTFLSAVRGCEKERIREGKSIQKHVKKFLTSLISTVTRLEKLRVLSRAEMELRISNRFKSSGLEKSVDPSRLAQELILYLDKSDITEEIHRLKEHIFMCMKGVRSSDGNGKKFDFYAQELLREINTIGSKANHAGLTSLVVDAKTMIESFKEQVQNIE